MGEFAATLNNLVDAHTEREEDVEWLKGTVARLEGCSRHKHVKICGIPEMVPSNELWA